MALYSTLQTIAIDNNARMAFVIQTGKGQMEAPNWSRDGKTLIFDRGGKLWTRAGRGRRGDSDRYRRRDGLHRQPRPLARRQVARDDLHHAGPSGPARVHCSLNRRRAAHGDGESQLLLP